MQNTSQNFYKKLFGLTGEQKALKYLKKKKYKILETNYTTKIGEADIIAKDGEYTVFVEVKTRSSERYGTPGQAVDGNKRHKYVMVAKEYLIKHKLYDTPCRFDVIEIEKGKINHIKDAFML